MTTQGVLVLALIALAYLLWVVSLVRQRKLHASYAVLWVLCLLVGFVIVAIPPLLTLVTTAVGAIFPASALSLLAFGLIFAMQIYLLSQLTILSRRVALISQHIAIQHAEQGDGSLPSDAQPETNP